MGKDEMVNEVVRRMMFEIPLQRLNDYDDNDLLEEIEVILGCDNPNDLLDDVKSKVNEVYDRMMEIVNNIK